MLYQIKVRVDRRKLPDFGRALSGNALNRSLIRSETYCLRSDPASGFSVWEADSREHLDAVLAEWRPYYEEVEIVELITPAESMMILNT